MPNAPVWRRVLRFWGRDVAADVDDELRFHFDARTEELRARGLSADEAARVATEEFGDVSAVRRGLCEIGERLATRRERAWWLRQLAADLRYVIRGLRATPLFTAGVVLTLALGLGAATSLYASMRRLLLQPPPGIAAPDRVATLYFEYQSAGEPARLWDRLSYPFYEQLRAHARTLDAVAAYAPGTEVAVGSGADAQRATATLVSPGYWRTLGARPLLGRFFGDDEAHPATGARVVVLSHSFWQRRFGGDPAAVGATLPVQGRPYRVVGVAPRGFRGVELGDVDLWLPYFAQTDVLRRPADWYEMAGSVDTKFVVRRNAGSTVAAAETELTHEHALFVARTDADAPRTITRMRATLGPLTGALGHDGRRIPEGTVMVWLVGVACALLGVACANVACLLLLRALRRRREIAVRLALGMSRRRLAALLFVESAALSALGGLGALGVAWACGAWVRRSVLAGLLGESAGVDWRVAAAAGGAVALTALVTGVVPVLQTRGDVAAGMRDAAQHGATQRSRLYSTLLVTQTALSAALLVGAGLFLRSLRQVTSLDFGLDVERALAVSVDLSGAGRSEAEAAAYFERALERVRAVPGVEHASVATSAPLRGAMGIAVGVHSNSSVTTSEGGAPMGAQVADDYFDAVGMRLVAGRGITAADRTGPPVVVVNEALARRGWPNRSPVGECAYVYDRCARVVGVVHDALTFRLRESQYLAAYTPLEPASTDRRVLLVRAAPGALGVDATLRRVLHELDPAAVSYVDVRRLGDMLVPQLRPWRLGASLFTACGVLAALLAALGLYTAMSYVVTQRTREIGVRLALGARAREVLRLVVGDGLRVAAVGIAAGLVVAVLTSGQIADLLFDTSAHDPIVFGAVTTLLFLVAAGASLPPARRAVRVSPTEALRAD